jgi:PAS domain S-box-containing protein
MEFKNAHDRLQLLEAIVTGANDAVVVTEAHPIEGPGPRIVYVNNAFVRMTGYDPDEVIGKDPRFLQGPDTDPETTARIRTALEKQEPVCVELRNYKKDGTAFWVEISIFPVRDAGGKVTHWAAVQRDVTDRHETEALARRLLREKAAHAEAAGARKRIEAILESITDAFLAIDRQWRLTYVNQKAAEYLGAKPGRTDW